MLISLWGFQLSYMNKSDRNKETSTIVMIHTPCDLIQFRLLPFNLVIKYISMQQMLKIQVDSKLLGRFVAMFENVIMSVSHMDCLIWEFSRGGRREKFLPSNTKWCTICKLLCSLMKKAYFKELRIPIS